METGIKGFDDTNSCSGCIYNLLSIKITIKQLNLKQMRKTIITNKLAFKKADVTELNDNSMNEINGGSTILGGDNCTGCCCLQISIIIMQDM